MSQRLRLLFLGQVVPYPPDGGVKIRSYHVLRSLAECFDVTAVCFDRVAVASGGRGSEAYLTELKPLVRMEAYPIPQEQSRARFVRDHLRSLAAGRVYTRYVYESAAVRRRLAELVTDGRFDIAHVDSLDLSGHLQALSGIPTICAHHNIESLLLKRRADRETHGLRRWYMRHQGLLMEREERCWCPRVALNVVVSEEDRRTLLAVAPGSRIAVVPNAVEVSAHPPCADVEGGVLFVGGSTWFPNRDGMEFFAERILPELRTLGRAPSITWVGRCTEEERRRYARLGITMTGYVDDVRPYVCAAGCVIVPLRVGGGTRLKIVDAWSVGKAVVTTSLGCEGLAAEDGVNALIRDEPRAFAEAVVRVLDDGELRRRLARGGRATAEEHYSWERVGRYMTSLYDQVAAGGVPSFALA